MLAIMAVLVMPALAMKREKKETKKTSRHKKLKMVKTGALPVLPFITLESNDKRQFALPRRLAKKSETLKSLISELSADQLIPLDQVSGSELSLVINSLKKIEAIASTNPKQALDHALDPLFVGKSYADLLGIIKAVNYLDIKVLLDYLIESIAFQLSNDSAIDKVAKVTQLLADKQIPQDLQNLIGNSLKTLNRRVKSLDFEDSLDALAISPDGKYALIGLNITGMALLYNLHTGKEIRRIEGSKNFYRMPFPLDPVSLVAFSSNCKYALISSRDAYIHDLTTDEIVKVIGASPRAVAFSPDGNYIIAEQERNCIALWDLTKKSKELKPTQSFNIPEIENEPIYEVSLNGDNNYALIKPRLGGTLLYDLVKKKVDQTCYATHSLFVPHTTYILNVGIQRISLFDYSINREIKDFKYNGAGWLTMTPNGKLLLFTCLGMGTVLSLLDLRTFDVSKFTFNQAVDPIASSSRFALVGLRGPKHSSVLIVDLLDFDNIPLTLPQIVLIIKLYQVSDKNLVLSHAYFNNVFNDLPQAVKDALQRTM